MFLQDLKLSPEPVGRTLAWRCFSAAGSTTERAVDEDVPATTAHGAGAVAAGGVTGNAGGLADPSDDSRRLLFAEFRRAMLNIAQALGTPVYLGGRLMLYILHTYCLPLKPLYEGSVPVSFNRT